MDYLKIEFTVGQGYNQYCISCHSGKVSRVFIKGKTFYKCPDCFKVNPRMIVIDPQIKWWLDGEKVYWHESAGVLIIGPDNKILFFKRTIFPFVLTIPAGHIDYGEEAKIAATREVFEEVGIKLTEISLAKIENVLGDSCRRGSDCHLWHLFVSKLDKTITPKVNDEGKEPVWLSLEEALKADIVYPVRYFLERYGRELWS